MHTTTFTPLASEDVVGEPVFLSSCYIFSSLQMRVEIREVQDVMVDLAADLCRKSKKRRGTLWWLVIVGRARHGSNETERYRN